MADYSRERAVAAAAVREAAQLCRRVQAGVTAETILKKDRSPVTVADFGSQALVCRALRAAFPDDPIIAEEDAAALRAGDGAATRARVTEQVRALRPDADAEAVCAWIDAGNASAYSERFWTLDPIDGTKGFLRGEQYAVALALVVDGEVHVAALACPNLPVRAGADAPLGAVFTAVRGAGALVLPLDGPAEAPGEPVRVSDTDDAAQARFCESVEAGHTAHGEAAAVAEQLGIEKPSLRMDSQAKYAVVARGEADLYLRLPTRKDYNEKIWDHAAGMLVVEEAGGRVTDIEGRPLLFSKGRELTENRGVVVSNRRLHAAVLEALTAVAD